MFPFPPRQLKRRCLCGTSWTSSAPASSTQTRPAVPRRPSSTRHRVRPTHFSGPCGTCSVEVSRPPACPSHILHVNTHVPDMGHACLGRGGDPGLRLRGDGPPDPEMHAAALGPSRPERPQLQHAGAAGPALPGIAALGRSSRCQGSRGVWGPGVRAECRVSPPGREPGPTVIAGSVGHADVVVGPSGPQAPHQGGSGGHPWRTPHSQTSASL